MMRSRDVFFFLSAALSIAALLIFWWSSAAGRRGEKGLSAACPTELPGGVDPARLTLFHFEASGLDGSRRSVFQEDLQEWLLAGDYQVVSARSELGVSLPESCVPWRLEIELGKANGAAKVVVRRFGDRVIVADDGSAEPLEALAKVRRTLAGPLRLGPGAVAASLGDPDSAAYRARIDAMLVFARGRVGEAAARLASLEAAERADAAVTFRQGRILAAWGGEMLATSREPFWQSPATSAALAADAGALLDEAQRHLDRAVALEPRSPMALYFRARVSADRGEAALAELDFERARQAWPAYSAAEAELARLRLARGETAELRASLQGSLRLADPAAPEERAALLESLGRSSWLEGDLPLAIVSLRQALELIPVERRKRRSEVRRLLAAAEQERGRAELPAPGPARLQ